MSSVDGIDDSDAYFLSATFGHAHFNWGFSRRGIYELDWQATGINRFNGETVESDLTTFYWAVGGYAQWLASYFSNRTLIDPSASGPQADPDGDGLNNLYEYAFDSHPRIVDHLPNYKQGGDITTPQILPDGTGRMFFCYGRREQAASPQIQYYHETSRDLQDWQAMSEEGMRTEESGKAGWEVIHLPLPESPTERHYYRVRVTLDR
jgi:surface-anchored protein